MRALVAGLAFLFASSAWAVTVSMTSPSNGALYLAPATLPVKANASASGVGINRVEFYANGSLIQTVTTSPYQLDWSAVAAGSYSVYAIAYDNNGVSAQSASRTITVAGTNTAPTVSVTTPADNSRYLNPTSISISANASGPELNDVVQSVAFYLNGSLAQTVTQAPFSYSATGLAFGTYTLTAVATDSQGAQTTSSARTFTVSDTNVPPTVSLVVPVNNSLWNSPATVTFQASVNSGEANDTVSVEFFANNVSQGVRTSAPWSITQSLPAATYTVTAVATDGQGAQTTSTARTIMVSDTNLPPVVTITSPAQNANFPTAPAPSIAINTTATGPEVNGWITKVDFYADGALIGTRTYGPWNFTWTNVPFGAHTLIAIAYDNFNASTMSAPINITVGPVPALHFIEVDHLNTPRAITDANQNLKWTWDQAEPFGVNAPDENPSGLGAFEFPVRFLGQYADKETNLSYNYFRDYDPATGRYPESDPIGLRGGINTYLYAKASPVGSVDPLGLASFCCRPLSNAFFGGLLGKKHCFVVADDGNTYSLFPTFQGGAIVGQPIANAEADKSKIPQSQCFNCPAQCGMDQNQCLANAFTAYPTTSYSPIATNSNTFAGTLARKCCAGGVPGGVGGAPGVGLSMPDQ